MEKILTVNSTDRILEAAKTVFLKKGLEATKMQDIAEEAGISRTSLHYYYHKKESLFEAIFEDALNKLMPELAEIVNSKISFSEKIEVFISKYVDMLLHNPMLPRFILIELQRNPEKIINIVKAKEIELKTITTLESQLKAEAMNGRFKNISLAHFFSNLYSLCIFPFLANQLIEDLFFDGNQEEMRNFLDERKKIVTETILKSLKP
jgi:TetR/AcrR family transcriptional regulator